MASSVVDAPNGDLMENELLKKAFRKTQTSIVNAVNATSAIDFLFEKKIISDDDVRELLSKEDRRDRCRSLLSLLHSAQHPRAFVKLRLSLRNEAAYDFLVDEIDRHYNEYKKESATCTPDCKNVADNNELSLKTDRISPRNDLSKMLSRLLCAGKTELTGEIHPILIVSRPDACLTRNKLRDCFKFLSVVPWNAVFDFDNAENDNSVYRYMDEDMKKVYVVTTVDIFDYRIKENEAEKKSVLDSVKKNDQAVWFFANGYNVTKKATLQLREWTRQYSVGFNEALTLFSKEVIPRGRALIVFLLLSSDCEVMTSAAESVCPMFEKCWLTLAETEEIAASWKSELSKKVTDEEELSERCVIGMPWEHVDETFIRLFDDSIASSCQLTSSTGAEVNWSTKANNDCAQLDVLSCNACANTDLVTNPSRLGELHQHMDEVQQEFYRGRPVSWWNFFFRDQVLQRDQFLDILQRVSTALESRTMYRDQVIEKITLHHQPSAGGTTIAKQVMWELRSKYRCAVVKKLTDAVYDQVFMLRSYKDEKNPKPVLLLLDDYPDEAVNEFVEKLVDLARKKPCNSDANFSIFFVLIICSFRTSRPKPIKGAGSVNQFYLEAKLSIEERMWVVQKFKTCEEHYKEKQFGDNFQKQWYDPQNFISFNVMKSNFDSNYMREVVRKYTQHIALPAERQLLKYVSLISKFGIGKLDIPLSSFDSIMQPRWETSISEPLQILLNDDPQKRPSNKREVRIINRALSKYVYEDLTAETKELEAGVMLELLDSGIFISTNDTVEKLLEIIRNLMKNRENAKASETGQYREYFSPLIEAIYQDDKQSVTLASAVLKRVFNISNDLFVGQQIARLYIKQRNWPEAVEYGKIITQQKDSSYLLDTLGQAYKKEFDGFLKECKKRSRYCVCIVPANQAEAKLKLAFLAIDTFRQGQHVSTTEKIEHAMNDSVHFNELRTVETIFGYLSYVEGLRDPNTLTKFLQVKEFEPESVMCWHPDSRTRIKEIVRSAKSTISLLADDYFQRQMKSEFNDDFQDNRQNRFDLLRLKSNITAYLVPQSDEVPAGLSSQELSDFYRGRIERLGGDTLLGLVNIRNDGGKDKDKTLEQIIRFAENNIGSKYETAFDYKVYLGAGMMYNTLYKSRELKLTHSTMAHRSAVFYRMSQTSIDLEPYLFAIMLNWPRDSTTFSPSIQAHELRAIMVKWKEAFDRKYPRKIAEIKKKDATYFFLAKGNEIDAFAYSGEFGRKAVYEFFDDEKVKDRLEKLSGVLLCKNSRSHVNVTLKQDGNEYEIDIPAAYPQDAKLFNKKVTFYMGFQWSGPKAFGIARLSDEEEWEETAAQSTTRNQTQFNIGDHSQFPGLSGSVKNESPSANSSGRRPVRVLKSFSPRTDNTERRRKK